MFWVGKTLYDRRTGWIAAVLAAIAPFCVWYSQEARMYSQFMLFAAVAIGAQVLAIRRGRWYDWGLYAVSTALLFWTQYFGIMPILVQQAAFGWAIWQARATAAASWRRSPRAGSLSPLVIAVLILPMIPILQASSPRTATAASAWPRARPAPAARSSAARSRSTPSAPT